MSMHDRDWYHDRPFRPPPDNGWRLLRGLALIAVGVMLVLIVGRALKKVAFVADPSQAVRLPMVDAQPETRRTLHRCIVDGTVVYEGPQDCSAFMRTYPARSSSAEPAPPAKPSRSVRLSAYQQEMLRSADARIARDEANARAEMSAMRPRIAEPRASVACDALEREIEALDAWARQPLGGARQDQIRAQRQEARSRQAALRC